MLEEIYKVKMPDNKTISPRHFNGLSTDTKPTINVANGASFYEVDTEDTYIFNLSNITWYKSTLRTVLSDGITDVGVNLDGQLHVVMEGKIDTENTTTTPLLASAIYTGTWVNVLAYSGIGILVGADVPGTLQVQYSNNGVDSYAGESYALIAGANKFFSPPRMSAYYRLVYTNSTTDQTTFYIHPIFSKQPFKWSSHNIDDAIVDQDDAELVKAVITGKKVNGDYDNVSLTNGANMKISLEELESGISVNSNTQLKVTPYESTGGEYKQDLITGAYTTITYAHHEIHSGSLYRAGYQKDVANAGTTILAITTPDTTTWAHFRPYVDGETEFNAMFYENPTSITGGTTVTPRNANRNSSNSSVMTVVSDPTVDLTGATVIGNIVLGSNKSSGGSTAAENEWILKQNTIYVMVVTNQTSSANEINIRWSWYEHTNRT